MGPACGSCLALAAKMNEWGPDGCEQMFEFIVDDIASRSVFSLCTTCHSQSRRRGNTARERMHSETPGNNRRKCGFGIEACNLSTENSGSRNGLRCRNLPRFCHCAVWLHSVSVACKSRVPSSGYVARGLALGPSKMTLLDLIKAHAIRAGHAGNFAGCGDRSEFRHGNDRGPHLLHEPHSL